MFIRNNPMHLEIIGARTDVEPLSVVENSAADLSAFRYPVSDNRDKGNFWFGGMRSKIDLFQTAMLAKS